MNERQAQPLAKALTAAIFEATRGAFNQSLERGDRLPAKEPKDRSEIEDLLVYQFGQGGGSGGYKSWSNAQHFERALEDAVRKVVIDALAIEPCHITGMHTPEHHVENDQGEGGYTCRDQLATALTNLLATLGTDRRRTDEVKFAPDRSLPRKLHDQCGWCHRVPDGEKERRRLRRSFDWADELPPPELMERGSR